MKAFLQQFAAALVAYGPPGIFLLAVIDSAGVPLPAVIDVLLIGAGAANVRSPENAYFTALMAVVGSVMGNMALFMAARQGARWIGPKEPAPGKRRFRAWFYRYGMLTVFVPAVIPFLPLPLKVFVVTAGAMGSSFKRFVITIATARVIRYFGQVYLGLALGGDAKGFLMRHGWTISAVAVVSCIAVYLFMRYSEDRRESAL